MAIELLEARDVCAVQTEDRVEHKEEKSERSDVYKSWTVVKERLDDYIGDCYQGGMLVSDLSSEIGNMRKMLDMLERQVRDDAWDDIGLCLLEIGANYTILHVAYSKDSNRMAKVRYQDIKRMRSKFRHIINSMRDSDGLGVSYIEDLEKCVLEGFLLYDEDGKTVIEKKKEVKAETTDEEE